MTNPPVASTPERLDSQARYDFLRERTAQLRPSLLKDQRIAWFACADQTVRLATIATVAKFVWAKLSFGRSEIPNVLSVVSEADEATISNIHSRYQPGIDDLSQQIKALKIAQQKLIDNREREKLTAIGIRSDLVREAP